MICRRSRCARSAGVWTAHRAEKVDVRIYAGCHDASLAFTAVGHRAGIRQGAIVPPVTDRFHRESRAAASVRGQTRVSSAYRSEWAHTPCPITTLTHKQHGCWAITAEDAHSEAAPSHGDEPPAAPSFKPLHRECRCPSPCCTADDSDVSAALRSAIGCPTHPLLKCRGRASSGAPVPWITKLGTL